MIARITYWPMSRWVIMSRTHATMTMREPQIIGLRGPNCCSSFSPTRMKAMITMP